MPFRSGDVPDWDSLATQTTWLADQGVDALWLNGSTGEFHALTDEERTRVVTVAVEAIGDRGLPIVNQVGSTSTRLAARLAAASVEAGANAISVVLPYYLPYEQDECLAYLRDVKSAAGGAPLYLYQVPVMTKTAASEDLIVTLLQEGVINGMKDSLGNMGWFRQLMERVAAEGLELPSFIGDSTLLTTSMVAGGIGTITAAAAIIPKHIARNVRAIQAGDWETAIRLQSDTARFIDSMKLPSRPNVTRIATIKGLLTDLGVIAEAACAAPFRQLDEDERRFLRENALPVVQQLEDAAVAV
jgi:4-hydroxy-tetrahydrodipicolinate synthase